MTELRLIAGSGRSGTTWVLDALADANRLRPVFEPLHPFASDIGSTFAHRFLAPGDSHPELREFLEDVIAGRRDRLWTQYRRFRKRLFTLSHGPDVFANGQNLAFRWAKFLKEAPHLAMVSMRRIPIVKCIRANLMLGWIARQFDCRIALVMRHPGAVIESELRNAWDPTPTLDRFRKDSRLHQMTDGRYLGLLERKLSRIQGLAVQWLVENQLAFEMAPSAKIAIFFYERLQGEPESTWESIRFALGLERAPTVTELAKPSQQTSPAMLAVRNPRASGHMWRKSLSRDHMTDIQAVLDEASCNLYSMRDDQPDGSIVNPIVAASLGSSQ